MGLRKGSKSYMNLYKNIIVMILLDLFPNKIKLKIKLLY